MIAYILDAARASGLFDTIYVSTESSRIANVVDALGFPITFLRPAELADDHTPLMPVLRHVVSTFSAQGRTFDEVWLLMACAPLIEPEDLREAARLLTKAGRQRPIIAVARYPAPFERAFRKEAEGTLVPIEPAAMKLRSQDLEARYYDTGSFCAIPARLVSNGDGQSHFSSYIAFQVGRAKQVDIDDEEDWQFAEIIFAGLRSFGHK